MKKEKVNLIKKNIGKISSDKKVIDIGCRQGVVSYFIRELGGRWVHTDMEISDILKAKLILKKNIIRTEIKLPFKPESADIVFCLDMLEHVDDDKDLLKEINSIIKKGGTLIISTPISGKFFILNKIKSFFGLKPEIYGHKREGYSLSNLMKIVKTAGFKIKKRGTYSKFFTELIEMSLNIIFVKIIKKGKVGEKRTGSISPESEKELKGNGKVFLFYKIIYPFLRAISLLDKLLFFKTGYATFIIAEKDE
jgi:SAM-dependent methyltransferase